MKLWLAMATAVIFFSGCNSHTQNIKLQNTNAQQSLRIQQQQLQIDALRDALNTKKSKAKARARGASVPQAPKKNIKLKKVEDNNYSAGYMYPGAAKKKKPIKLAKVTSSTTATTTSTTMGKPECIAMIGQAKFDKYTQMFGSEASSIKRCSMLKAMR